MLKVLLSVTLLVSSVFASSMDADVEAVMSALGGFFMLFVLALFAIQIMYLLSIIKTIKAVKTEHSTSMSILPWFTLVPVIGWIVGLVVVSKLSGDYKLYVQKYEIKELYMNNGGQTKGMVTYLSFILTLIPFLGILTGIVGFIAWIMYWIELGNMRSSIAMFNMQEEEEKAAETIAADVTPQPIAVEAKN